MSNYTEVGDSLKYWSPPTLPFRWWAGGRYATGTSQQPFTHSIISNNHLYKIVNSFPFINKCFIYCFIVNRVPFLYCLLFIIKRLLSTWLNEILSKTWPRLWLRHRLGNAPTWLKALYFHRNSGCTGCVRILSHERGFFSCNVNGPAGRGPKGCVSAEQALSQSLLLKVWALPPGLTIPKPVTPG